MHLAGQARDRGYAMAAILVVIAVMSIILSVALPVWKHELQREKEAELVFRGQQYVRAIGLYVKRYGPGNFPPSVDVLVQQKFLRKKYKDPITDDDFQLLYAGALQQAQPGQPNPGPAQAQAQPQMQSTVTRPASGGIMGVASKSKDQSIRVYNGRTHYNEWQFIYAAMSARPGGPGGVRPGTRPGMRPGGPSGPGGPMGPGGPSGPGGPMRPGNPFGPGQPMRPRPPAGPGG